LFDRFTERARRSIFFARYEASQLGTPEITSDELLLGILREDRAVATQLGIDDAAAIRREIESIRPSGKKTSTSIDLPLSEECQRVMALAVEEADAMHHKKIEASHLVLGLLRVEASLGAQLLRKRGVEYQHYRTTVEPETPASSSVRPKN
jgi:ATP-dependent Clp protease ATP-binding subunit ClpC